MVGEVGPLLEQPLAGIGCCLQTSLDVLSRVVDAQRRQGCTDLLNDRAKDLPHHITGGRSIRLLADVPKILIW